MGFQEQKNLVGKMMIKDKLRNFSSKHPKEEVCGFVVIKQGEIDLVKCVNRAEDRENHFLIPAIEYLNVKKENPILGVFHSHVFSDSDPSSFDIAMAESSCLPMIIYSNKDKKFGFYNPEQSDVKTEDLERIFL